MERRKPTSFVTEPTRDSAIRKAAERFLESFVPFLHEKFPFLTANQITALSAAGVVLGTEIADLQNQDEGRIGWQKIAAVGLTVFSYALDGLDGSMARYLKSIGKETNPAVGQLVDVGADRLEEVYTALQRAVSARKRGDPSAEFFAYLSAITSTWPSIARALAEAQGIKIPESGRGNPLNILGTRVGRVFLSTIATVFPEICNFPLALTSDLTSTIANIYTTFNRLAQLGDFDTDSDRIPFDKQNLAKTRVCFLLGLSVVTTAAAFLTYKKLHPPVGEIVIA